MKKAILLSTIFALFAVNCSEDAGDIDSYGPNQTIVGFAGDQSASYRVDVAEATVNVPVDLISYANETLPTSDVVVTWSVDPLSTAVAGVDYDLPADTSVIIPAGSTVATFPIIIKPVNFDPSDPKSLILNLVSASNAIVGMQYSKATITLQGLCVSDLAGLYSTVTYRPGNDTYYYFPEENIVTYGAEGTYITDHIGQYHGNTQTEGTSTNPALNFLTQLLPAAPTSGFIFTEVCGKLRIFEPQTLANGVYSNDVSQSDAQFANSFVDEETGVITIEYSIWFTNDTVERPYISVFTPL